MRGAVLGVALLGAGCSLAPPLPTPTVAIPAAYKEAALAADSGDANWKPAAPQDAVARGAWWEVFGDVMLNQYESTAAGANQDLAAALARLESSRALVRQAHAAQLPRIDLGAAAARGQTSANDAVANGAAYNRFQFGASLQYELDLFGRVRDGVRAAAADAEAQAALFQGLLLSLQSDVAQTYFLLRAADAERAVLDDTVAMRAATVAVFASRVAAGAISELDLARAQAELGIARSDAEAVRRSRAQYEHALALLLGQAPAAFSVDPAGATQRPPAVPAGLPSALLERRPDIAAAQRRMMAANARIGVARAAFYPIINLSADAGFESSTVGDLFKLASRAWALGPLAGALATLPLFDGGRNRANLARAESDLDAEIATYRQTVLTAFREVEDQLIGLRTVAAQAAALTTAETAASRAFAIASARFDAGATGYLDVLDARRTVVEVRRQQARLDGASAATTVALIKSLGGGW